MTARVGVVVFPGSNCEHDVVEAVRSLGGDAELLWHEDADLHGVDAVVVPGGFAHGGGPVVGICNGFQVLTEAGLLPGALQKNRSLKFVCTTVGLTVASTRSALTQGCAVGDVLQVPVNHFEGSYTCDRATLDELVADDRIVLRYVENPNGSLDDIAGICSPAGNVVGLMPHPERAVDALLGSADGAPLLRSLLAVAAPA